jgi:hypothetical protein
VAKASTAYRCHPHFERVLPEPLAPSKALSCFSGAISNPELLLKIAIDKAAALSVFAHGAKHPYQHRSEEMARSEFGWT